MRPTLVSLNLGHGLSQCQSFVGASLPCRKGAPAASLRYWLTEEVDARREENIEEDVRWIPLNKIKPACATGARTEPARERQKKTILRRNMVEIEQRFYFK